MERSRPQTTGGGGTNRLCILDQVKNALPAGADMIDSVSLRMNKFVSVGSDPKLEGWRKIVAVAENNRRKMKRRSTPLSPSGCRSFTMLLQARMLVDHNGTLANASLNLHRFFGYPTIPGSALKGIARHTARQAVREGRLELQTFLRVFGNEPPEQGRPETDSVDNSGNVAFLAAEPADDNWKLGVDVLTGHGDCDTKNPIPVFFPVVERGARFRFVVVPLPRCVPEDLPVAEMFLKEALTVNGVGAKTAAGYGWFGEEK